MCCQAAAATLKRLCRDPASAKAVCTKTSLLAASCRTLERLGSDWLQQGETLGTDVATLIITLLGGCMCVCVYACVLLFTV